MPSQKNISSKSNNYSSWDLKDFKNYYKENYSGKGAREVSSKDSKFYRELVKRNLTNEVFPTLRRGKTGKFEYYTEDELKNYYNENLSSKGKTEIWRYHNPFYRELKKRKSLDKIVQKQKRKTKTKWDEFKEEELKDYYEENFKQIEKTLEDYISFRHYIRSKGLLKRIISK